MKRFTAANDKQYPVVLLRDMCPKGTDNHLSALILENNYFSLGVRVHIRMNKDLVNVRMKEVLRGVVTQTCWDVLSQ